MNKHGFALLQLLVALTLSSLVATTLFMSLFQLQKIESRIQSNARLDRIEAVLRSVLTKDILSVFIPTFMQEAPVNKPEVKNKKQPMQFLVSKNGSDKMLNSFTFITTHCVQTATPAAGLKPFLVRVTYVLKKAKEGNTYILERKQTHAIVSKKQGNASAEQVYEIARGITSCVATFHYLEKNPNAKKDDKKVIKKISEWDSDKQDQKIPSMPLYVSFDIKIVESTSEDEISLLLQIPLCNQEYGDTLVVSAMQKEKNSNVQNDTKKATSRPDNALQG